MNISLVFFAWHLLATLPLATATICGKAKLDEEEKEKEDNKEKEKGENGGDLMQWVFHALARMREGNNTDMYT